MSSCLIFVVWIYFNCKNGQQGPSKCRFMYLVAGFHDTSHQAIKFKIYLNNIVLQCFRKKEIIFSSIDLKNYITNLKISIFIIFRYL